jgi:hypothetical protein
MDSLAWCARIGWGATTPARHAFSVISTVATARPGLEASGSPANWRCMKLEKFSRIELLEGVWHTAPNHSRPQTCITDVDLDAEDYPDRNPQSGQ